MRPLNEIIIHATATRPEWWSNKSTSAKVNEVRKWHIQDRGWSDVGYHFLIDRDGTIAKGRPIERIGAHVQGHNTGTIGVALFGGYEGSASDHFLENFTLAQEKSLIKLLGDLQGQYGQMKISGHNQYAAKACPCFNVLNWLASHSRNPPVTPPTVTIPPVEPLPDTNGFTNWLNGLLALIFGRKP